MTPSEQKEFAGAILGGGGLGGDLWLDRLGLGLRVASYYVPVDITVSGQVRPNDMIDTFAQVHGAYKLVGGADWEAAVGAGGFFRYTYNASAQGATYLTTDKTYFGAGPVLLYGYRGAENFTMTSTIAVYPVFMQNYTLPVGPIGLGRWGSDFAMRGEYWLSDRLFLSGGGKLFLVGGAGGRQSVLGASFGAGYAF